MIVRVPAVLVLAALTASSNFVFCNAQLCNVCGNDNGELVNSNVQDNSGPQIQFLDTANQMRTFRCARLQQNLNNGVLPGDDSTFCSYIQSLTASVCECSGATTAVATTPEPTPAPLVCNICGSDDFENDVSGGGVLGADNGNSISFEDPFGQTRTYKCSGLQRALDRNAFAQFPGDRTAFCVYLQSLAQEVGNCNCTFVFNNEQEKQQPAAEESCNGVCRSASTTSILEQSLTAISSTGRLCLCPVEYRPESGNCPVSSGKGTESSPILTIAVGQNITMECVTSSISDMCSFGCAGTIINVQTGGSLNLVGLMDFTGGMDSSRIIVDSGGTLRITSATFRESSAINGCAIENAGTTIILGCIFEGLSASENGGAILGAINSTTTIVNSTFVGNTAGVDGAAIYSTGYVSLRYSFFAENEVSEENSSSGSGGVIGPLTEIRLEECDNVGLYVSSQSCNSDGTSSSNIVTTGTDAPSSTNIGTDAPSSTNIGTDGSLSTTTDSEQIILNTGSNADSLAPTSLSATIQTIGLAFVVTKLVMWYL